MLRESSVLIRSTDNLEYQKLKGVAHSIVDNAIRSGELIRLSKCELCDIEPPPSRPAPIVAHHYRGHEYPLDVWWICRSCNGKLHKHHDGLLTKRQARKMVGHYTKNYWRAEAYKHRPLDTDWMHSKN